MQRRRAALLVAMSLSVLAAAPAALTVGPGRSQPADAEVVRLGGYEASVDGYRSWFGSYEMAGLGTVWCVDHGVAAPDADFRYRPTELGDAAPSTRTAMAWALGRYSAGADRPTAAALMLVLHDLMGARYPSGPLDVDRLSPGRLDGFEGEGEAVLQRARAIKADAVAHAHLRGPLALSVALESPAGGLRAGQPGVLLARLTDAAGKGVTGVALTATAIGATLTPGGPSATDGRGEQRFSFTAGRGENRFAVSGTAPDLQLHAFSPSTRPAQRVGQAGQVPLNAGLSTTAQTHRLSVRKRGDASAYLSLAGARFQVRPHDQPAAGPAAELVSGENGNSPPIELDPGRYLVNEVAAPAGYAPAGPWTVDLTTGDVVLDAVNTALPGTGRVTKVDAGTGRPLAGATLAMAYDAERDGAFETSMGQWVSGAEPATRELQPGDYEVREVAAPAGYRRSESPVRFTVAPGQTVQVTVANAPLPAPPPAPAPPARPVTRELAGPALRHPAPKRAASPSLPETGRSLSLLGLAGSGLLVGGSLLSGLSNRPARRARRRARSLVALVPRP